ncbi:MAG: DotI/IcmL/TraM family protein [Legionella sp.]|nr:DotI/IcmL/TraM family protein [Legionella sp.]
MKVRIIALLLSVSFNCFAADQCQKSNNDGKIIAWGFEAMMAIYSGNFTKDQRQVIERSEYLTKSAKDAYIQVYDKSGMSNIVKQKKLITSVGLYRSPLIMDKKQDEWVLQMPLTTFYQSATEFTEDKNLITLKIIKDPKAPDCLRVSDMKIKPVKDSKS